MIKKQLYIIFAFLPFLSFGQQFSKNSHFYENLSVFNPSTTGLNEYFTFSLNARQQWYNFSESSIGRSTLSLNKGFNNDGIGVEFFSDNSGNIINSGIKINYSRRVIFDSESFVYYGISGGYQNNRIENISSLDFNYVNNRFNWTPIASFGATYTKKSLLIGASVDGLLDSDLGFTENENIIEKNYYLFLLYEYEINQNLNLTPSILYIQTESDVSQFDLNLNFCYDNTFRLGFGYIGNFVENTNFGPLLTFGINFNNLKSLISQEFATSEVSSYSVGTTELTIKYEFKENVVKNEIKKVESSIQEIIKIDTDKDGIIDEDDECPNLFGSKSANGCPDLDKDGVKDSDDLCPNTIGELLNNGCPVLSAEDSVILENAMTNLEFDKNSADIKTTSIGYIRNIGKLMLGNKNMILIISGHTDSDASEEYNYSLSAKRAKSVRDFLVKMGVQKSRLIIDFYGESQPLLPNTNESNMQKNRRVEFTVTFI